LGLALIDQDGVVADFEKGLLQAFRAAHPAAQFIELPVRRVFYAREQYSDQYGPEWGRAIDDIIHSKGFYRSLPVIAGAVRALEEMREAGHEVLLCTSQLSRSLWNISEKISWIVEHFGESWLDQIVIAKDKTLVGARYQRCILLDDRPQVTGRVVPPPWTHVLFDAPYNRNQPGPRLLSWADWREVLTPYLGD
jgi:5'-nucleotidase